jgi:hypothetical protein
VTTGQGAPPRTAQNRTGLVLTGAQLVRTCADRLSPMMRLVYTLLVGIPASLFLMTLGCLLCQT